MNFHSPPPVSDPTDIRLTLDRVTGSAVFRSSPQLVAFLRFIVEMTLMGQADRIKAYTIGTDALGRDPSFDPQSDPIVRVEANRLRRALFAYYAGAGADDPIVIDVPLFRYVPTFRHRFAAGGARPAPPAPPKRRISRSLVAGAAVLALLSALTAGAIFLRESPAVETGPLGTPVILIEPIQAGSAAASSLATALGRELTDLLAHIQAISVVSGPASPATDSPGGRGPAAAQPFRLTGNVETRADGTLIVALRLLSDDVIAWTRTWRIDPDGGPGFDAIARDAAVDVARFSGIMHARMRAQSNRLSPGYRCLLAAADNLRKVDLTQQERIRDCLEQTAANDPNFALTYTMLAFVYEREFLHDLPARFGDAPALERSLQAAQRALALKPNSASSQLAMMENLYLRGDLTAAFAAGETAMSLNPIDPMVSGLVGLRLVLGGETERGADLLEKAASRFGTNASLLDFGLFCLDYIKGDMPAAARHVDPDAGSAFPYSLVARALSAEASGDHERARQTLERLTALYPGWSEPRKMLERSIRSPAIVDRLARGLAAIAQP